ncbi:unnamed protein product [Ectocarpus sp. 6 AP-2014]
MAQPGRSPEVDAELKKLQGVQSELQALAASRSQFYQQANENGMVKQASPELDLLEDEAPVFKLVGPVLIKQDLEEAKQNVAKRLELIEREMAKVSKAFEEKQKEEAAIGDEIMRMQGGMKERAAEEARKIMEGAA